MSFVLKQDYEDLEDDRDSYVAETAPGAVYYGTQREAKRFRTALSAYRLANRNPLLREELLKVLKLVPKAPTPLPGEEGKG